MRLAHGAGPERRSLRVWALLCLFALGLLLGSLGAWLTGSEHWFLAVPACVAIGWLFFANPLACQADAGGSGSCRVRSADKPGSQTAGES